MLRKLNRILFKGIPTATTMVALLCYALFRYIVVRFSRRPTTASAPVLPLKRTSTTSPVEASSQQRAA